MTIDDTLAERGSRYGEFDEHAEITQSLKEIMYDTPKWGALVDDQKEALEMVAHKIGRILNGDPNYVDSWTDIAGYVRLVERRLISDQESVRRWMDSREDTVPSDAAATQTEQAADFDERSERVINTRSFREALRVLLATGAFEFVE